MQPSYFENDSYRGPMAVVGVSFGLPRMDEPQIKQIQTLSGEVVNFFDQSSNIALLSGTSQEMKKSRGIIEGAFNRSGKVVHASFDHGLDGYYGIDSDGLNSMAKSILDRLTGKEDGLILLTIPLLTGHLTRNIRKTGHANLSLMNGMAHAVDKDGKHFVIADGLTKPY